MIADPELHLNQLEAVQHDVAQLLEHGLTPPPAAVETPGPAADQTPPAPEAGNEPAPAPAETEPSEAPAPVAEK
jgi:hypothetical protein